jgi:hypothetical protein
LSREDQTLITPTSKAARNVFREVVDACGAMPITEDGEAIITLYLPDQQSWTQIQALYPELVSEIEKAICLIFAEEVGHTVQFAAGRTENGPVFISQAMKDKQAPVPGKLLRRFIELDNLLYLIELGFGPYIKDSLWLATHEREYGPTLEMCNGLKIIISKDDKQWFK